ncbi:helix-turn-helix domain-containing protein [Micromonospora sp. NPDC051141]|uniref:helix-turn-helix domain-containing protein n=1 Tax=Micromonospora sp. NPDC051141 TaxID=3364284 RepID=UPI00378B7EF6
MSRAVEESNRAMLRARDAMDRAYAQPLDIPALARIAYVSEAHFIRTFRATFGETPHRYLQRRRIERAMYLLVRTTEPVTEICHLVGFGSLGTFSRTFHDIVGESPSAYRRRKVAPADVPSCFTRAWMRPSAAVGRPAGPAPGVAGPGPAADGRAPAGVSDRAPAVAP